MADKIKWKNLGGSFRMESGRIIKPNQVFDAAPENIPKGFRDVIVPVAPIPPEPALKVAGSGYQLRHRGGNWYEILDAQGKVVNEKALRQDEARNMLEALAPGEPVKEALPKPEEPGPEVPFPATTDHEDPDE